MKSLKTIFRSALVCGGILASIAGINYINKAAEAERLADRNENQEVALVNSTKTGISPYVIIDEDRDGTADFIAGYSGSIETEPVLFIRESYVPKSPHYTITKQTKKMNLRVQSQANEALNNQRWLNYSLENARE